MSLQREPNVALVLGGGGVVGGAYLAGVLLALEHDLHWDAREADLIVGTSVGAMVGTALRMGVSASDLAALTVDAAVLDAPPAFVAGARARPTLEPFSMRQLLRLPRTPGLRWMTQFARGIGTRGPLGLAALTSLLPDGVRCLEPYLSFLEAEEYPPGLWLCAVRRSDGRRVVFGRGDRRAPLAAAVAASCAVPGYFRPVQIDGCQYLDGGIVSNTNADTVRRVRPRFTIVVSPMSARRPVDAMHPMRGPSRWTVRRERSSLQRAGLRTLLIEPGPEVLRHVGHDMMSDADSSTIVRAAFLDTGAFLSADPRRRQRLVTALQGPETVAVAGS